MSVLQSSSHVAIPKPHVHVHVEECPWCEQPIPNERFEEISKRIAAKEREWQSEVEAKSRVEIETVRKQGLLAIDAAKTEAAERVAAALQQGRQAAETEYAGKLAEATQLAKSAAEREGTLTAQLAQARQLHAASVETLRTEFAAREIVVRDEASKAVQATMLERTSAAEAARQEAERLLAETKAVQEEALKARLAEQREALEKSGQATLNEERSKAFKEKQKLEDAVQDLQRQLQKKSTEELGEGAEVDLYEVLKAEFPDDKIARVPKGTAGADIIHDVQHNGMVCGRIVYDSKNREAWRTEYVAKLRIDQIAAKADHAVLSTHVFPAGAKQLHVIDGVLLVNPARALMMAIVLRKHIVQVHALRVSNDERAHKTEELYAFITSERCGQYLDDIDVKSEDMLEIDVKEKRAHEATWKKRGELIRAVQRSRSQLCDEIERIIGMAPRRQ